MKKQIICVMTVCALLVSNSALAATVSKSFGGFNFNVTTPNTTSSKTVQTSANTAAMKAQIDAITSKVNSLSTNYQNSINSLANNLLPTAQIDKLKEENKKLKDQYVRTLADTENFKKRIDEERIRDRKYGSQRLLEKLIVSLDIFDKAVNMKTDDPNLNNFLIGFQMINNNINQVLEEEGVKKIKATDKFDPRYHDAIETDYDETKEEGTILMVIKDGYMYKP